MVIEIREMVTRIIDMVMMFLPVFKKQFLDGGSTF